MALNSLLCADVPLRNYSHSLDLFPRKTGYFEEFKVGRWKSPGERKQKVEIRDSGRPGQGGSAFDGVSTFPLGKPAAPTVWNSLLKKFVKSDPWQLLKSDRKVAFFAASCEMFLPQRCVGEFEVGHGIMLGKSKLVMAICWGIRTGERKQKIGNRDLGRPGRGGQLTP